MGQCARRCTPLDDRHSAADRYRAGRSHKESVEISFSATLRKAGENVNYSSQSMNRGDEPRAHVQWDRSMRFRKSFRVEGNIANLLILTVVFFLIFPHGMSAQASEDVPSLHGRR